METTAAPTIGSTVTAWTMTRTAQRVRIEVTAIDLANSSESEWVVWGYRVNPKRAMRTRQTMIPRIYLVRRPA